LEKKGGETYIDTKTRQIQKARNFAKGGRRNWKKRWFVLYANGVMEYYADENGQEKGDAPKGSLRLTATEPLGAASANDQAEAVQCCTWYHDSKSKDMLLSLPDQPDAEIVPGTRLVLQLRSSDSTQRQAWISTTVAEFGADVKPGLDSPDTDAASPAVINSTTATPSMNLPASSPSNEQDLIPRVADQPASASFSGFVKKDRAAHDSRTRMLQEMHASGSKIAKPLDDSNVLVATPMQPAATSPVQKSGVSSQSPPIPAFPQAATPGKQYATAGWDFKPVTREGEQLEAQLAMRKGDVVEVIDGSRDDWWLVARGTAKGYAPAQYLKLQSPVDSTVATSRVDRVMRLND